MQALHLFRAAQSVGQHLQPQPADSIVYFPAGRHELMVTGADGNPQQVRMEVDEALAQELERSLAQRMASGGPRPFIGFDHESGPAAALPLGFRWEEGAGVVLEVEWTQAGRDALAGRNYSYFSPAWLQPPGSDRPTGVPPTGEIGSLTNDPAFGVAARRMAASNPAAAQQEKDNTMTQEEIDALRAEAEKAAVERDEAKAALEDIQAQIEDLKKALTEVEAERDALRQAEADSLAASAARDGRIAEAERPRWAAAIARDPEARKLLAALPAREKVDPAIHKASRAVNDPGNILATYRAMSAGPEKDKFRKENAAQILAAERAERN